MTGRKMLDKNRQTKKKKLKEKQKQTYFERKK